MTLMPTQIAFRGLRHPVALETVIEEPVDRRAHLRRTFPGHRRF